MAVSFVASSVWAVSVSNVTPTLPTGVVAGDLNVLALVSKYDDAVVGTPPGAPWTDHGAVANTGRSAGNDTGNLRTRAWSGVYDGSAMPTLDPAPNNVSVAHVTGYRVAAGKGFDVTAEPVKDDTVGSPLTLTAASTLGLTAGDVLHIDLAVNGDVVTFGTPTLTVPGCTMSAASTNTVDSSTTSGTDLRYRSVRYTVTAGTATGPPVYSLTLAGTTTNAVGVGVMARVREVTAAEVHTSAGSARGIGSALSLVTTVRALTGSLTAKASALGLAASTRTAVAAAASHAAATSTTATVRTTSGQAVAHGSASGVAVVPHIAAGTATARGSATGDTATTRTSAGSTVARASTAADAATTRPTQAAARAAASGQGVSATTRVQGGTAASVASGDADVITVRTATGQAISHALATGAASGGTGTAPEVRTTSAQALARASIAAAVASLRTSTGIATARALATTAAPEAPMPTVYNLTPGPATASRVTVTGPGRASAVTSKGART